jgi:predicted ATPase
MATGAEAIVVGPSGTLLHADELVSLTERQSISYFSAQAMAYQGWCLTMLGQPEKGMTQLTRGLAAYRAQGLLHVPMNLTLLADAYCKVQQPQNGLQELVEAISVTDRTQARYYEAEMHRVRGELFLSMYDNGAAEASFRKAISVAQHQSAKTWELRAAMSMARLWRDQGKRIEARDPHSSLRLVRRRLRHARSERGEGVARRTWGVTKNLARKSHSLLRHPGLTHTLINTLPLSQKS